MKWLGASLAMMVLLLSGCAGDLLRSKVEEPTLYTLRADGVATANVAYPVTLRVALPQAAPGLDTDRIAVLKTPVLDYYLGARWSGDAAQVVQSYLISYLQTGGGYKNVVSDAVAVDADYSLVLELRDFQAEYASKKTPVVHVALAGALVDVKQRRTVAVLQSTGSVMVADNRLDAVIDAFNQAMQQVSAQLVTQLQQGLATP